MLTLGQRRGDQDIRCEYYKKEGHKKEECWCLHPHLQLKGLRRGGFTKGGDRRQGEKGYRKEKVEKMGYAVRGEGYEVTQRQAEPSTSQPDLMWQLAQHLSMLLQTNKKILV
jgi:hypothetical protein